MGSTPKPKENPLSTTRRIVLPDLHCPFHDQKLLDCWFERLATNWFDGVDIIGDFLDCYTLSRFDTNPQRKVNFQVEVDMGRTILEEIRALADMGFRSANRSNPGTKPDIRYSEGNHEDRLRKILWGNCKALAGLRDLTIPEILGLKDLGIKWHSVENPYKIGDLWYTHGDLLRSNAGVSARAKSDVMGGAVMIGHCHRMGWCPRTTSSGTHDAYECGHMADKAQLDYARAINNWQLGWAEVTFHSDRNTHHVDFFKVVDRGRERMVIGPEGIIGQWRTRR